MPANRFSNIFGLSYTSTIPFEDKTFDSEDLARLRYFPLDSDGKFSDLDFKVFTARQCQPLVFHGGSRTLINLDKSFRSAFDLSVYPDRMTTALYRPIAIKWTSLRSMKIKDVSVTDAFEMVKEHSNFEQYCDNDENILNLYKTNLKINIRYAMMHSSLRLQWNTIGDFKTPDQSPINPTLLNFDTLNFSSFEWLKNSDIKLSEWNESLLKDSKDTIFNYIEDLKSSVQRFRINTKLDDYELWCTQMENQSSYIDTLREFAELTSMVLDVTKFITEKIWTEYANTQLDLTHLMNNVIEASTYSAQKLNTKDCFTCCGGDENNETYAFTQCGHSLVLCDKNKCCDRIGDKCPFCRQAGKKIKIIHQSL